MNAAPEHESEQQRINRYARWMLRNGWYGKFPPVVSDYAPEDREILQQLEQKSNAAPEPESASNAAPEQESCKEVIDE